MTADVVGVAARIADDVLFPDAMRVDRLDTLPVAHLDALAAAGLYGAAAPREAGGLGLELPEFCAVVQELASGCLAAAFIYIQHAGLLMRLAYGAAPPELREKWLTQACQGTLRGGIALTGQIPGPPMLRAEPAAGGWRLDGTAPWVTGWGLVDLRLIAVDASVTVKLGFDGLRVPAERFVSQVPFDPAGNLRPEGLRVNGSLALGVARRCCRLLGPGPLDGELVACRAALDAAIAGDTNAMAQARAAASELAVRAAAALAVREGSGSVTGDSHAQRLAREALFLLVFGSRPPIKDALQRLLTHTPETRSESLLRT
jgi:hypothetical protein